MAKKELGVSRRLPNGLYEDKNKRSLLIDFKKEKVYVVAKEDERKYMLLRNRYVAALMIFIILTAYVRWPIAVAAGIAALLMSEYAYRKVFLSSLQELKDVVLPKKETDYDFYLSTGRDMNVKRLIASCGLFILLIVSTIFYINSGSLKEGLDTYLVVGLVIGFSFIALRMAYLSFKAIKALEDKNS